MVRPQSHTEPQRHQRHQQHQRHRPRRSARLCAGDPAPLHGATETLGLLAAAYGIELPQHQPLEVSQIASNCHENEEDASRHDRTTGKGGERVRHGETMWDSFAALPFSVLHALRSHEEVWWRLRSATVLCGFLRVPFQQRWAPRRITGKVQTQDTLHGPFNDTIWWGTLGCVHLCAPLPAVSVLDQVATAVFNVLTTVRPADNHRVLRADSRSLWSLFLWSCFFLHNECLAISWNIWNLSAWHQFETIFSPFQSLSVPESFQVGRSLFCILAAVCPGRPLCPSESPQPQPCSDHIHVLNFTVNKKMDRCILLLDLGFDQWENMRNMRNIIEISETERRTAYRSVSESGLYALGVHRGAVRGWSPSSRSHLRDGFGTCCCLADRYGCGRWWTVNGWMVHVGTWMGTGRYTLHIFSVFYAWYLVLIWFSTYFDLLCTCWTYRPFSDV